MARVLLIEDDPGVRTTVERLLSSAGHKVILAADGREGVRLFRANPADLVITDLVMPNQDGIETIIALTREFPKVPIIAMSGGSAKEGMLSASALLGAVAVLEKPFSNEDLLDAVRQALGT